MAYYLLLQCMVNYKEIIKTYHYSILIFNMLPIYPLDGGKILYLLLSTIIPFKKCLKMTFVIGVISIIFLLILNYPNIHLNLIITISYLMYKITKEYKEIEYLYNKLLLERYINNYNFKNKIIIKSPHNFYKNKAHVIRENDKYYLEKEYLEKKYKKIQKNC